jgi:L-lactate dehydrogenase complex protein LldE
MNMSLSTLGDNVAVLMEGPQVQLVVTCLVDAMAPRVGRAALSVLERAGCRVDYPAGQTCCGQPALNTGHVEQAREMAAHTLEVLDQTEGAIVVPSGSCAEMMIHHYPALFAGTPREAQAVRVAGRVRELTRFLIDDLDTHLRARAAQGSIAFQYSCHGLRGLGLDGPADRLLFGAERAGFEGDRECCGFGGLFSIEMPAVSGAIMDGKLDRLEASGASTLAGGDISCLLHLEGGLRRRGSSIEVKHIAELLDHEPEG